MNDTRAAFPIVLADDDPDDRMLALRALKQSRVANPVLTVADGEELMDYLLRRGSYTDPATAPRPGLILLDLNMPRKDGREVLREVKAHDELRRIPVIVLTTSQAQEDVVRSYDLGVNAFITKPVTFGELVRALRALGEFWFKVVRLPD